MSERNKPECSLCDGTGEVTLLDQVDVGCPACIEKEMSAKIKDLEAEVAELHDSRDIWKRAAAYWWAEFYVATGAERPKATDESVEAILRAEGDSDE